MSFIRKALLVNSTEFVCLLIGIAQTIILTRVLGPAGIGQYAILISAGILTLQIVALGLPYSFLYHSQHDPENTSEYLINTLAITIPLGLVGGGVLAGLIYFKSGYFGVVPCFLIIVLVLEVLVGLQRLVVRNVLMIKIQARSLSLMRLAVVLGSLTPVVILSYFGLLTVPLAVLATVLGTFFAMVIGWSAAKSYLDLSQRPSARMGSKLCFMGFRQGWADIMSVLDAQISLLLIKYFVDDFESVGYFSRGLRIAMLLITAGQAIFPLLYSRWASCSEEKLAKNVEKTMRFASAFAVFAIVCIILTGKWVVLLFWGREFMPAVRPMIILLPGTVLLLLAKIMVVLLGSRGLPEISALFLFVGAATNAALCWFLIPNFGIEGAAWASVSGNLVLFCALILVARKKFDLRVLQCIWVNKRDVTSIWSALRSKSK